MAGACATVDVPRGVYGSVVVSRHERFSLHDVTFAGVALPTATVDCWDDSSGRSQWQARVVTRDCPDVEEGELSGHTADRRALSGPARVADRQAGPGSRRETLVVFHGTGTLHGR
jgi:hypothetical protein